MIFRRFEDNELTVVFGADEDGYRSWQWMDQRGLATSPYFFTAGEATELQLAVGV